MSSIGASIFRKHTLVIPTYNRPILLNQLIRFYTKQNAIVNLLVLDSSKPEIVKQNSEALSHYGTSVRHISFPETEQPSSKLKIGLDFVQTSYVSFCADDDLVFPDSLKEAIEFIDEHLDYVCAHGLYLNFRVENQSVYLGCEYGGTSIDAINPCARIFRLFQKYESLFYAAFRTEVLKEILPVMVAQQTYHYQELTQTVTALIKGKSKRFPKIYAARRSGPPVDENREKWQTHYWFAESPTEVLEDYRVYCNAIWNFYEAHSLEPRLDQEAFYKIMDLAHAVYFSTGCPTEYFYSVLQHHWPNDHFHKTSSMDLFDSLQPPYFGKTPSLTRILGRIGLAIKVIVFSPWVLMLNRISTNKCQFSWKCHLRPTLWWLSASSEFRRAYLTLCLYLDES